MKIKSIKIENFKIHKNSYFEFDDKNIIIGENGVGKTSIFQSIIFSLFGERSLKYIGINKVDPLIRYYSNYFQLELDLGDIRIIRRYSRNGENKVILEKDGNIIASGAKVVERNIKEFLNINRPSKILDVLYIRQGELGKYINLSGKVELTKKLEELFDIDIYSNMIKVIESSIKDLEKETEYLEREKSYLEKDLYDYRRIYGDKNLEELEKEVEKYEEIKKKYDEYYKYYLEIKTLKENIDYELLSKESYLINREKELSEIYRKINEERINIKSEINRLEYKEVSEELLKKSLDELENLKNNIENEIKDLDKYELNNKRNLMKDLINRIDEFKNLVNSEEEYKKINEEIREINERIFYDKNKIKEIERNIEILKEETKRCPVCMRELSEDLHKKLLEYYNNELNNLKEELEKLNKELEEKNKILKDIEYKFRRYNSIKEKLIENNIDINNLDKEKDRLNNNLNEIEEKIRKIDEYNILVSTINYIKKKNLNEALKKLEEEMNKVSKDIDEIKRSIGKIENMKKNLEKINEIYKKLNLNDFDELENIVNNLRKELEKYQNLKPEFLKKYKEILERYEKTNEKIRKMKKNIHLLQSLYNILIKYIEEIRREKARRLSEAFKYYFRKLYKYNDIIDIEINLEENRKGEKIFTIYVTKNIDGKSIRKEVNEAGLSGGQIKVLDLAFRLALSSVIKSNLRVIMLDEPTESLDENIRSSLAELINSIKDYQVILCTHDELFREKIEGKILELNRSTT